MIVKASLDESDYKGATHNADEVDPTAMGDVDCESSNCPDQP